MDDDQRMEETAPWWFPSIVWLMPGSACLVGNLLDFDFLVYLSLVVLFFLFGIGITIETIFKNKTGYDIDDLAVFDAAWHIFIVQKRSRQKQ